MIDRYTRQRLHGLYAITDQHLIPESEFAQRVEAALKGGVRILQYRDKSTQAEKRNLQAMCCKQLCRQYDALFIINDDIDLCQSIEADGIHLGKDDEAIKSARHRLGDKAIIGVSCYNDIERAVDAQKSGADYVAFGAMFSSSTKPEAVIAGPETVAEARQKISLPVCAIGGIETGNARQVIDKGADMIAVISSLFASAEIENTARQFTTRFGIESAGV
jgi:thiamine-phosphate pyrophosphorylase